MTPVPRASPLDGVLHFVRFLATGGIAAGVNLLTRYLLDPFMLFEAAVMIAYVAGMAVAFVLFQKLIFGDPDTPLSRRMFRFTLVNLLGAALALAVSSAMARLVLPALDWTFRPAEIAHLVGVCVPAFSSYVLHKRYTFAPARGLGRPSAG